MSGFFDLLDRPRNGVGINDMKAALLVSLFAIMLSGMPGDTRAQPRDDGSFTDLLFHCQWLSASDEASSSDSSSDDSEEEEEPDCE